MSETITLDAVLDLASRLSRADKIRLVERVRPQIDNDESGGQARPKRNLMELRGLGKEIWQGVDVDAYIDELRDDWDRD